MWNTRAKFRDSEVAPVAIWLFAPTIEVGRIEVIGGAMHDQLIRLDKASLRQMKRDASAVFTCVSHAQALEAMARGLGANSFNDLRRYAREYGAILWDQSEGGAATFLAMRGSSMEAGDLAWIVEDHVIDHEAIPGFDAWIHGAAGAPARTVQA